MKFTPAALVRGNLSLTARLVLGSGVALVGCGAALLYSMLRGEIIDQRATLSVQLREEMSFALPAMSGPAVVGDYSVIEQMVKARARQPTIARFAWTDNSGHPVAAFGPEIRLEAPVERVVTRDGRATGVALADGTEFHAGVVVSALDPRRTFLELVEPRELPDDLVEDIRRLKFQGVSSKVNFALDGLPGYPGLEGREDIYRGFLNIGPSIDYVERAFDEGKYGWYSSRPYLDCAIQSTIDPDMAPPGKHVMSCFVQYAPYKLRESDWDTERDHLGDTVQATLESFFPGFGSLVLQREVRTPLDIERTVGLTEGNIFAGEFLAPQMYFFRPAPGWSDYRTPIDGYYQCGSGTHPGGCVMGAPGKLAAQRIVRDRERAAEQPKAGAAR